MTDKTSTTTPETDARRKKAASALSALSAKLHPTRGLKTKEQDEAKEARRKERLAHTLTVLTTGDTGCTSANSKWGPRTALIKVVSAVKYGATVEDLLKCKALHEVAPWSELVEPVTEFAEAKGVDPTQVLAGLGIASAPDTLDTQRHREASQRRGGITPVEPPGGPVNEPAEPQAPEAPPAQAPAPTGRVRRGRRAG